MREVVFDQSAAVIAFAVPFRSFLEGISGRKQGGCGAEKMQPPSAVREVSPPGRRAYDEAHVSAMGGFCDGCFRVVWSRVAWAVGCMHVCSAAQCW